MLDFSKLFEIFSQVIIW